MKQKRNIYMTISRCYSFKHHISTEYCFHHLKKYEKKESSKICHEILRKTKKKTNFCKTFFFFKSECITFVNASKLKTATPKPSYTCAFWALSINTINNFWIGNGYVYQFELYKKSGNFSKFTVANLRSKQYKK